MVEADRETERCAGWYCQEEAQAEPLSLGGRAQLAWYWLEPSRRTANGAGCQWAPEAWPPQRANQHLKPSHSSSSRQPAPLWAWTWRRSSCGRLHSPRLFVHPRRDWILPTPPPARGSLDGEREEH